MFMLDLKKVNIIILRVISNVNNIMKDSYGVLKWICYSYSFYTTFTLLHYVASHSPFPFLCNLFLSNLILKMYFKCFQSLLFIPASLLLLIHFHVLVILFNFFFCNEF